MTLTQPNTLDDNFTLRAVQTDAAAEKVIELNAQVHGADEGDVVRFATVDMGRPRLKRSQIPMTGPESDRVVAEHLDVEGQRFEITAVSMGNPHCIIFTDNVDDVPLEVVGPAIENHPAFPERINVHVVEAVSRKEARMRTWERGTGITLACGTGASAVCVAGVLTDRLERRCTIHLPGGSLDLHWREDDTVAMTGPATEIFSGEWPLADPAAK